MKKSFAILILILEFIIALSYLAGFYRGMNECKKIYENKESISYKVERKD